jgi:hypothetical protein
MRATSPKFMAFLCLSLLAMQVSGLHLHTNLEGSGGLHGTHAHAVDRDGHDHEADTDVSFLELAAGWVKTIPFLLLFIAIFLAVVSDGRRVWAAITKTFQQRRYSHWRPPLRAPPDLFS